MSPANSPGAKRLVRDYSTDGMLAPPSRFRSYAEEEKPRRSDKGKMPQEDLGKIQEEAELLQDSTEDLTIPKPAVETYESSVSTDQTATESTTSTSVATDAKLANFFGPEVFQLILQNPTTAYQLRRYAQSKLCEENLDFLEMVSQYQQSLNQVTKLAFEIHSKYISVTAPSQVNVAQDVLLKVNKNLKTLLSTTMPSMESAFTTAQKDIEKLVASEIYPGFVRQQMIKSATKALATNRSKYAGLGDCFVLTNPNKPDNPIVYASDGFVKVTGYRRDEIIPRNCRFLQGRSTDPESINRIRKSVKTPSEHVELLLNVRKDGEPFWNLLYTAPLYDHAKNLVFFIGGQVNISTTVHDTSDVLRILAAGDEDSKSDEELIPPPTRRGRQLFFNPLRKINPTAVRTPGMENDLLREFNSLSFQDQKTALCSAYSKFLVINAQTMLISYYSTGTLELLFPIKSATRHPNIAGEDIFKFLTYHSQNSISRDYKTNVRCAIRNGQAISIDLRLCTRRTMGFENFVTHWTPLKDEHGSVGFVVLTFSNLRDAHMYDR